MRFEMAQRLLDLAGDMQASRVGISLKDIENTYEVSYRTAQRMKEAVEGFFPQIVEVDTGEQIKRWRIPAGTLNKLVSFTADEIADLEGAIAILDRENLQEQVQSLRNIEKKVRLLLNPDVSRRIEPDVDALIEAEGIAMRPGPRPLNYPDVIDDLRHAIKACQKVRVRYLKRRTQELKTHVLLPHGFLLGHRHYLIAKIDHPKANRCLPFSIPNVETVEILEESFVRDLDFSLQEYAEQSFGIYQGEPMDVVWRFTSEAALHAKEFMFHPSQQMEEMEDGSLIVRFRASGKNEMIWHLYTWGDNVEVLEPAELADEVNPYRRTWEAFP
jgi:predicted DNA-binding transcriptional regulator YafY